VINDAAIQALGSYNGGKMLFIGLGTGLGSCMIVDGIIEPMELGHLPYKRGTYEDYVGRAGLEWHGKRKWRRHIADVVTRLIAALQPDETVIGGGNVRKLKKLPPHTRAGRNADAFRGGFLLWQETGRLATEIAEELLDRRKEGAAVSQRRGTERATKSQKRARIKKAYVVFLFDVDNTLLDNDRVQAHLKHHLQEAYGVAARDRYWEILEQLRNELGYIDYLGALERYRIEEMHRPELLRMSSWLVDYPFADALYPGALEAVKHVQQWGIPVILSDGDAVFQPRKVERSGLWNAVDGRVLIYVHKEQELADVERLYPADHYVLIDDKLRILAAVKDIWGARVTTVFPKQGHYALDPGVLAEYPPADVELPRIGALMDHDLASRATGAVTERI
jgi:FMN phosphatase YigB (HAD superfamily)